MRRFFLRYSLTIRMLATVLICLSETALPAKPLKSQAPATYPVRIRVIADSLNQLQATVQVQAGTNARDLLKRLFHVEFADLGEKFVKGIAGFVANGRKKEYWALEIDGEYSKKGIAEITIHAPVQIVWTKRTY